MKKVIVIGCPGAGKSTFARGLSERTGLPLFYLDMMYWNEDRTTVSREVLRERQTRTMAGESWIIDGNYISTMALRLEACDTVILLDYDVETCLAGIAARRGKKRPDMPWIEEEADEEFLAYIRQFRETVRPRILALLAEYREKRIVVFHGREDAERFLEQLA